MVFSKSDIRDGIFGGFRIENEAVVDAITDSTNKVHDLGDEIGRNNEAYNNLARLNGELRTCAGIWSANNQKPDLKDKIITVATSIIEAVSLTLKEASERTCYYDIYPDHSHAASIELKQVQLPLNRK